MAKDPAFLFYPSDFLTGVSDLTMEERGIYITLLCLQHQKGRLSEKMIRLCHGIIPADVLQKFSIDENGLYYNVRLEQEIEKRKQHSEKQRNRALDGWKKRKNNDATADATALPLENRNKNDNTLHNLKGGMGENMGQNLLIPEMQKIFCESNAGYVPDSQMDFLPLMTIAKFVLKKFFPGESDVVKNKDAILEKWRGICGWISQNNFYKTKPLKTIANQIQEILQSPENGTNKSSNSNGTPKSRRDKHYDSMHELLRMGQEEFDKLRGASTGS